MNSPEPKYPKPAPPKQPPRIPVDSRSQRIADAQAGEHIYAAHVTTLAASALSLAEGMAEIVRRLNKPNTLQAPDFSRNLDSLCTEMQEGLDSLNRIKQALSNLGDLAARRDQLDDEAKLSASSPFGAQAKARAPAKAQAKAPDPRDKQWGDSIIGSEGAD